MSEDCACELSDLSQDALLNLHEVHRSRNVNQESIFGKIILWNFVEIFTGYLTLINILIILIILQFPFKQTSRCSQNLYEML